MSFKIKSQGDAPLPKYPNALNKKSPIQSISKDELIAKVCRDNIGSQLEKQEWTEAFCKDKILDSKYDLDFTPLVSKRHEDVSYQKRRKIAKLELAIVQGVPPEPSKKGAHGAVFYKTKTIDGTYIGVFKTRVVHDSFVKRMAYKYQLSQHSFIPKNDLACEKAAYIVAKQMNLFSPIKLCLAPVKIIKLSGQIGAFFIYHKNCVLASAEKEFLNRQFHEISELNQYQMSAIFDMLIGNLDRHPDNAMLSIIEGQLKKFALIDNANSFIERKIPSICVTARKNIFKCWMNFKIADAPFTEEIKKVIEDLKPDFVDLVFKEIAKNGEIRALNALSSQDEQFPSYQSKMLMLQRFQMIKGVSSGEFTSTHQLAENVLRSMIGSDSVPADTKKDLLTRDLLSNHWEDKELFAHLLEQFEDSTFSEKKPKQIREKKKLEKTTNAMFCLSDSHYDNFLYSLHTDGKEAGEFLIALKNHDPRVFEKVYPKAFRTTTVKVPTEYLQTLVDNKNLKVKSLRPVKVRFKERTFLVYPTVALETDAPRDRYIIDGQDIDPEKTLIGKERGDAIIEKIYQAVGDEAVGEKVQMMLHQGALLGQTEAAYEKYSLWGDDMTIRINPAQKLTVYFMKIDRFFEEVNILILSNISLLDVKKSCDLKVACYAQTIATFKVAITDLLIGDMSKSRTEYALSSVTTQMEHLQEFTMSQLKKHGFERNYSEELSTAVLM